jgi:hypothetical protein
MEKSEKCAHRALGTSVGEKLNKRERISGIVLG